MTNSPLRKSRIPHWSWLLAATGLIVGVFVAVRYGLPIYRQHEMLVEFDRRGFSCTFENHSSESDGPAWMRKLIGERWTDSLYGIEAVAVHVYSAGPAFCDADMQHLTGLKSLKTAELLNTHISDSGLAALTGLQELSYLNLAMTPITDGGLVHLAGLRGLQQLDLGNTKITDAGLIHLHELVNLRALVLKETQVGPDAIAKLQSVLPRCKIEH